MGSSNDFLDAINNRLDHHARLESDLVTLAVGFSAAESARANRIIEVRYSGGINIISG